MCRQPRPNPICSVCHRPILPGVGRMRRGLTSTHIECEKRQARVVSAEAGEAGPVECDVDQTSAQDLPPVWDRRD